LRDLERKRYRMLKTFTARSTDHISNFLEIDSRFFRIFWEI